jgi:hypothetical protein
LYKVVLYAVEKATRKYPVGKVLEKKDREYGGYSNGD